MVTTVNNDAFIRECTGMGESKPGVWVKESEYG
jgi:hypothetical protein